MPISEIRHFDEHYYSAPDGLRLFARVYGAANATQGTVACLPGLTRNCRDFHNLALHLSGAGKQVVCFDYRGRGQSDYDLDSSRYNVVTEAGDVIAGLDSLLVESADFIGTSRGGIIIHFLAAMRPDLIKFIVFNDIGPVIEVAGLMRIKTGLARSPQPRDWQDAINIQRNLHGREFPALTLNDWAIHARAIYRDDEQGGIAADFDLNLVKTLQAIDPSVPLPTLWPQFDGLAKHRLLVIRGENSKLFAHETMKEMSTRHKDMQTVTAAGQGHAPMLWTAGLPERIAAFLT